MNKQKESITLLHGVFTTDFFERLKKRKVQEIFVTEGRPSLEAARINCCELLKRKITPTLISDNMAGLLFFNNLLKEVWMTYQISDAEGAVCDIGALILGVLGKKHSVPVYLIPSNRKTRFLGKEKDVLSFQNKMVAPQGIRAYVPLVEWLPMKYITKVIS